MSHPISSRASSATRTGVTAVTGPRRGAQESGQDAGGVTADTATRPVHGRALQGGIGSSTVGMPPAARPKKRKKAHRGHKTSKTGRAKHRRSSKASKSRRAGAVKGAKRSTKPSRSQAAQPTRTGGHRDYHDIVKFAQAHGFTVTSTTGGKHNTGSAHYQGRAADIRIRDKSPAQIAAFKKAAQAAGFIVRNEASHPHGQKVWSGPHLHLEVPKR